jgi:hypothetical protein
MTPVKILAPTEIAIALMLTMPVVIYAGVDGAAVSPEYFAARTDVPMAFASTSPMETKLIIDSKAQKWIKFQGLVAQWRVERGVTSSITKAAMMPSYLKIIGMGDEAIPLIFNQIRSEGDDPDQWFLALESITGVDPTKPEDRGDNLKMAKAWLNWNDENSAG